jgi:hypothetical protein
MRKPGQLFRIVERSMADWRVTHGDQQFSVPNLAELKKKAVSGDLLPHDMIQPPGATDWIYASELPDLKESFKASRVPYDVEAVDKKPAIPTGVLAAILGVIVLVGGGGMYHYFGRLQNADMDLFSDKASGGLELTEMLVTANPANLLAEPKAGASTAGTASKDSRVQLQSKRAGFYEIKTEAGAQGWVPVDAVVPGYFFADASTREDYDPIYNPDRYVFVKNSDWIQLPDQARKNITSFSFMLQNKSKFEMTDIVLKVTIKDKSDKVLEEREFAIEGGVPPFLGVGVGTLNPDPKDKTGVPRILTQSAFEELSKTDPTMFERWVGGVELEMQTDGFVEANVDIVQVSCVAKKLDTKK